MQDIYHHKCPQVLSIMEKMGLHTLYIAYRSTYMFTYNFACPLLLAADSPSCSSARITGFSSRDCCFQSSDSILLSCTE